MDLDPDSPYALNDRAECHCRQNLLSLPHIQPLARYLSRMRSEYGSKYVIPHFDPLDGGTHAKVLFLLQDPGPKTLQSGFISRNNPDPTAKNMCKKLREAGLARHDTLLWNVVPWRRKGTKKQVTAQDIRAAVPHLQEVLALLPKLKVVVLMGRKAQRAATYCAFPSTLTIRKCWHPSMQAMNREPCRLGELQDVLQQVAALVPADGKPKYGHHC